MLELRFGKCRCREKITGEELLVLAWNKIKEMQYLGGGMVTFLEAENEEKLLSFYRGKRFSQFDTRQTASDTDKSHVKSHYSVETKTLEDVVEMLKKVYLMDIRLKANTISYAFPYHANKAGKAQAVRGSKLRSRFTVAGIRQYMQEKEEKQVEYRRIMQDIEEEKQYIDDYEDWCEEAKKDGDSFYEAFVYFQAGNGVSENDEEIFYGSVFQEFNEQWQGKREAVSEEETEKIRQEK